MRPVVSASTHELLIDGFLESIIANQPPPVSAEEGREAVRVMNMIVEELGVAADGSGLGGRGVDLFSRIARQE